MMWPIRLRFISTWMGMSAFVWVLSLTIAQFYPVLRSFITNFALYMSMFTCYSLNFQRNVPQFFRTISPSLREAWFEYLFHVFTYLFINFAIYFFVREQSVLTPFPDGVFDSILYTTMGSIWLFLCAFSFAVITKNPKSINEPLTKKIAFKRIAYSIGIFCIWLTEFGIFVYSPLLGLMVFILFFAVYWRFDYFARTSLTPKLHNQIVISICSIILLFGLISYGCARATNNYDFLGHLLAPKIDIWKTAKNIKTIDDWFKWYDSDRWQSDSKYDVDNAMIVYAQLDSLCKRLFTDDPSELKCKGKSQSFLTIRTHWKDEDLIKLLSSENILINRIGILTARQNIPLTEQVKDAIIAVSKKNIELNLLASKTLSMTKSVGRNGLSISLYDRKD